VDPPAFHPFRSEQDKQQFLAFYRERAKRWPIACETRCIPTLSAVTLVRVGGREGDPPLVLLPGARGSSLMWIPNIAALSARHRTYALDLPTDVGLSVPRKAFDQAGDYVGWLDEVFDILFPGQPVSLLGISYGGWIAALYASQRPDRLRKVVLLAPGGSIRLSASFFLSALLVMLHLPGRREASGGRLRRLLRWLFEDALRSAGRDREAVEQDIFEMVMSGRFLAKPRLMWPTVFGDDDWKEFRVPALFLVGENEKIYSPRKVVRRLGRVAPQVRCEIVPGAGHDLTMVKPELVAERILAFLDEPAQARPSRLRSEPEA
jgi:pimeloyl-ACP methyl ester carboxylesterase